MPYRDALASVLTERVAFRPVRTNSLNAMLITSFAVSTLLQNAALLLVSPRTRAVNVPGLLTENLEIVGLRISVANVLTIGVSLALLFGLNLLLRRTTLGEPDAVDQCGKVDDLPAREHLAGTRERAQACGDVQGAAELAVFDGLSASEGRDEREKGNQEGAGEEVRHAGNYAGTRAT